MNFERINGSWAISLEYFTPFAQSSLNNSFLCCVGEWSQGYAVIQQQAHPLEPGDGCNSTQKEKTFQKPTWTSSLWEKCEKNAPCKTRVPHLDKNLDFSIRISIRNAVNVQLNKAALLLLKILAPLGQSGCYLRAHRPYIKHTSSGNGTAGILTFSNHSSFWITAEWTAP